MSAFGGLKRHNGLEPPYTTEQIAASASYVVLTITGFVVFALLIDGNAELIVSISVYGFLTIITVACWLYCELVNPGDAEGCGTVRCMCMAYTQERQSRYCRICNKSTPGLDHHCMWLNTDIGTRNYFQFYLMSVTGTLQLLWQACVGILIMTAWRLPSLDDSIVFYVLNSIHVLLAVIAGGSIASLWGFHTYLLWVGMGTYDWIVNRFNERERLQRERSRKQAELRKKEQEERAKRDADQARTLELEMAERGGDIARKTDESSPPGSYGDGQFGAHGDGDPYDRAPVRAPQPNGAVAPRGDDGGGARGSNAFGAAAAGDVYVGDDDDVDEAESEDMHGDEEGGPSFGRGEGGSGGRSRLQGYEQGHDRREDEDAGEGEGQQDSGRAGQGTTLRRRGNAQNSSTADGSASGSGSSGQAGSVEGGTDEGHGDSGAAPQGTGRGTGGASELGGAGDLTRWGGPNSGSESPRTADEAEAGGDEPRQDTLHQSRSRSASQGSGEPGSGQGEVDEAGEAGQDESASGEAEHGGRASADGDAGAGADADADADSMAAVGQPNDATDDGIVPYSGSRGQQSGAGASEGGVAREVLALDGVGEGAGAGAGEGEDGELQAGESSASGAATARSIDMHDGEDYQQDEEVREEQAQSGEAGTAGAAGSEAGADLVGDGEGEGKNEDD